MIEGLKLKGRFTGTLIKENGDVEVFSKDNLVVKAGIDFVFDTVFGVGATHMNYIAVGTGTTAVANTQTALVTQLLRKSANYSHSAGTAVASVSSTFNAGEATGAITEAGIFNASTAGIMFDRVVFPVINKGANDTYVATFEITYS